MMYHTTYSYTRRYITLYIYYYIIVKSSAILKLITTIAISLIMLNVYIINFVNRILIKGCF